MATAKRRLRGYQNGGLATGVNRQFPYGGVIDIPPVRTTTFIGPQSTDYVGMEGTATRRRLAPDAAKTLPFMKPTGFTDSIGPTGHDRILKANRAAQVDPGEISSLRRALNRFAQDPVASVPQKVNALPKRLPVAGPVPPTWTQSVPDPRMLPGRAPGLLRILGAKAITPLMAAYGAARGLATPTAEFAAQLGMRTPQSPVRRAGVKALGVASTMADDLVYPGTGASIMRGARLRRTPAFTPATYGVRG